MPASLRTRGRALLTLLLLFTLAAVGSRAAGRQRANEVFKKWLSWQSLVADAPLDRGRRPDAAFAMRLYRTVPQVLRPQLGFIALAGPTRPRRANFEASAVALRQVYHELESDMPGFVARLKRTGFATAAIDTREQNSRSTPIIDRYRTLTEGLFDSERTLLALANRMFEYAFSPSTFAEFRKCLDQPELRPIARLFYSTIWYNLSGNGWRNWHDGALAALREESRSDREIVYIAGGTDVYQLIRQGVYRIRNIDPIFPSQTTYYSEGWQYLIRSEAADGGIGDEIVFDDPERIVMRRASYREQGSFESPTLSNDTQLTIPQSETTWKIYDGGGHEVGYYILERRFATQDDFAYNPAKVFLISFNELAYVADGSLRGWGIDPRSFDPRLRFIVKQLRRPLDRETIVNMRIAQASDFSFIWLGTSVD